jgi:L-iditol 2-dehydrogenase
MARSFNPNAHFIDTSRENLADVVMDATQGEGVDCVVTTAGSVQSHEDAIQIVGHRGNVNLFGGIKNQPKLYIDSNVIHYKERFVMKSHDSRPHYHAQAVNLIAGGHVHASDYISKPFPLEAIHEAFAYHESVAGLKVIVKPEQ